MLSFIRVPIVVVPPHSNGALRQAPLIYCGCAWLHHWPCHTGVKSPWEAKNGTHSPAQALIGYNQETQVALIIVLRVWISL